MHVAAVAQADEHVELAPRQRAHAEQLDGRRKRRPQLVASQLLDPLRDLLGRARGADPLANPAPQLVLPLHGQRQRADGVLVASGLGAADRGSARRAITTHPALPLAEDLGTCRGVAVEQVGDPPRDREPPRRAVTAVATDDTRYPPGHVDAAVVEDIENGPGQPFDAPGILVVVETDSGGEEAAGIGHPDVGGDTDVAGDPTGEPVTYPGGRHGHHAAFERVAADRREAIHHTGRQRRQLRSVVDVQRHSCLDSKRVSACVSFWAACGPNPDLGGLRSGFPGGRPPRSSWCERSQMMLPSVFTAVASGTFAGIVTRAR